MGAAPEIIPLRCGTIVAPAELFETDGVGESAAPVYAFLITHPLQAPVLFDTGLHPDLDGKLYLDRFANTVPAGQDIGSRLEQLDLGAQGLGGVILSHGHYDHAGGLPLIGDAPVFLHQNEDASGIEAGRDLRRTGDLHDVFGDGSVELFATPGHTPGHQSLRVRTETGGEFVLCGDACYLRESLEKLRLPGVIADKAAALAVFHRFREMQTRGAKIMFGHDPDFWKTVPQAPVRLG